MAEPRIAPWSLRGITMATRKLALESASKQELAVAEWVARAIENQARTEQRNAVLPPPSSPDSSIVPAESGMATLPTTDFAAMTTFASSILTVLPDGADRDRVAHELATTVRVYLRAARGVYPTRRGGR